MSKFRYRDMLMNDDLYCALYINYDGELRTIDELVVRLLNGKVNSQGRTIYTNAAELDVRRNDYYKTPLEERSKDEKDAFLYWRYYIDVEKTKSAARNEYIQLMIELMQNLKNYGIKVVAACDFEDELPS